MYGKIFASMFTGSMMGAGGHVHSMMVYAVANADPKGYVELNPDLLAVVIGEPRERIEQAMAYLCAPDPGSRSPDEDGRRLVREGQFLYRIVNYAKYRSVRDKEARREQTRDAVRRHRERKRSGSICNQCKPRKPKKAQAEAGAGEDREISNTTQYAQKDSPAEQVRQAIQRLADRCDPEAEREPDPEKIQRALTRVEAEDFSYTSLLDLAAVAYPKNQAVENFIRWWANRSVGLPAPELREQVKTLTNLIVKSFDGKAPPAWFLGAVKREFEYRPTAPLNRENK